MSCQACLTSYGFFTKETGCPNCGFSFCTKCLKKTIAVPRLNNSPRKVCLTCFDRLTRQQQEQAAAPKRAISPDDILAMAAADDEAAAASSATMPVLQPTSPDDLIRQRLQQLKADGQDGAPSSLSGADRDRDIVIRIANLKDQAYSDADSRRDPSILLNTDRRTDQEKMADLLRQFESEVQLDANVAGSSSDPVQDIERRLAALRGVDPSTASSKIASADPSPVSESEQVKQLVARFMAEAALPDGDEAELELTPEERAFVANAKPTAGAANADESSNDEKRKLAEGDELPWCVICNEDAELRYQGDLFCKSCYREVRDDE